MARNHKIVLRQGTTVPSGASFEVGEPAWDKQNKKLYIKADDGTMVEIAGGGGGDSGGEVLIDASTAGTIYVGTAPVGSSVDASVWTIIKTTYTTAGIRTSKGTATNVTWTGRASHSYT